MARRKQCWGPGKDQHVKGCRPGRPLCRWMRQKKANQQKCTCGAYHYPHRRGSGLCGSPEKMWELCYGPAPQEEDEVPF